MTDSGDRSKQTFASLPDFSLEPFPEEKFSSVKRSNTLFKDLGLLRLYGKNLNGEGIRIAVVDTGVSRDQAMLHWTRIQARDLRPGADGDDDNGHGTCMVGLLASDQGVSPKTEVLSIRALDSRGRCSAEDLCCAIYLALKEKCDIISISAGQAEIDEELEEAATSAHEQGVLVVGAVRKEAPWSKAYPAACSEVVAVVPSYNHNKNLVYSSPPPWVTCGAPGYKIFSYDLQRPTLISGSSPAAAITAGVCALILSGVPAGTRRHELARALRGILKETGTSQDGGWILNPPAAAAKFF